MSPPMGAARAGIAGARRVGDEIPDSAVHQYRIDEGSGSTAADNIGTADLTTNGGTWASLADATGGFELSLDGTDDYISRSADPLLQTANPFSLAFTIRAAGTTREYVYFNGVVDGEAFVITIDEGHLVCGFFTDWSQGTREHQADQPINTSRHRICVTFDGTSETTVYIDAGSGSTTLDGTGLIRVGPDDAVDIFQFGEDNYDRHGQFDLDHPIVYDAELTASEVQQDYDLQPWA